MQHFSVLRGRHKGRPAVILGAGPSLPGQIHLIPEGAVRIAVNERPSTLFACDYVVFYDHNTKPLVGDLQGEKISPFKDCADYLLDEEAWFGGFSSTCAAFIACLAGCSPVILMGMDLYQGDREYFDDPQGRKFRSSASRLPLKEHMDMWSVAVERCPDSHVIKAAGGPLVEIFGEYRP